MSLGMRTARATRQRAVVCHRCPGRFGCRRLNLARREEVAKIERLMSAGDVDLSISPRMLEALRTDYVVGDGVPASEVQ